MVGKRVRFDDETWEASQAAMRDAGMTFQDVADEAFGVLFAGEGSYADQFRREQCPLWVISGHLDR